MGSRCGASNGSRSVGLSLVATLVFAVSASVGLGDVVNLNPGDDIQAAINGAVGARTINLSAGIYALPATLNVNQADISIVGAGSGSVTIGAAPAGYGIYVTAGNATLQGFTLNGAASYGVKPSGMSGLVVTDVVAQNGVRTGIDLNGVTGATLTNVASLNNGGHGISLTDCNGVTVTNATTVGSAWQSVSVATWGRYYPLGTSGIVFNGTNSFAGIFQLEEGDFNNPGVPPAGAAIITYSTNILDGADVTVQAGDFGFALHGDQDDGPDQNRVWFMPTLANAMLAATFAPIGHLLSTGIYIESLTDPTQLYASPGCTIQAAIDAADPGDTVNVLAGTYAEQLYINKNLNLTGSGIGSAILQAVPIVGRSPYNVTQWNGSVRTIDACIGVVGAAAVNISGLTVDGLDLGQNNFYGIHLFDSSGSVNACSIENITWSVSPGAQRVVSVAATHGLGQTINVVLSNNVVPSFQKGGLLVMGPGATFMVNNNSVTGLSSPIIAGNGIQLSYGASGSTLNNVVSGTEYTGASWASTGILLFESGDVAMVGDEVYNCQSGVNFSDWGWVYTSPVPVNLTFTGLNLHNNDWTLGAQLSRDGSALNMTVTGCDILTSGGDGIDVWGSGPDPWGGVYYNGWNNGVLNASITGCKISGAGYDGIWTADLSGNVNNVNSFAVHNTAFSAGVGSAINNTFPAATIDASGCYWGDAAGPVQGTPLAGGGRPASPVVRPFDVVLPAGGAPSPVPPPGPPEIGQTILGSIDYTPWMGNDGTYTLPGFAGDFSNLYVDDDSPQTGATGRVQEGVDLVTASTVHVLPGTYPPTVTIDKTLTLVGDAGPALTFLQGGIILAAGVTDVTIQGFTITGIAASSSVLRAMGNNTNFTMDDCVLDGQGLDSHCYAGGSMLGDPTITNSEFKNFTRWSLWDSRSGSGGDGSAMGHVTFAHNSIHECDGSIVFRGLSTARTAQADAFDNTWLNIGGNFSSPSQHWAAFEMNRTVNFNFYDNTVENVAMGAWGEGQALQMWDIDNLDVHNNCINNNAQGIQVYGLVFGDTFAVPGGTTHHNDIAGNAGFGISVDPTATGGPLVAESNWWGGSGGPSGAGPGTGDSVSANVDFDPWVVAATCMPGCGNGIIEGTEACDDGNANNNDGCLNTCVLATCGDGFIQSGVEACDDSGATAGDGCDASCQVETGWGCTGEPSACTEICGDGQVVGAEDCDPPDGQCCSATCAFELSSTACDDTLYCNGTDTCDATGGCTVHAGDPCVGGGECNVVCNESVDNCFDPSGTTCGAGASTCHDQDTCDGAGGCAVNNQTSGTPCGDATNTDCTDPDTCSGFGACNVNHAASGTPCGDPSDTDCTNPDTCDGNAGCQSNHEPASLECRASVDACDPAEFCTGVSNDCPADDIITTNVNDDGCCPPGGTGPFDNDCFNPLVPTVSQWGMLTLTLLLLAGLTIKFGNRRSATA